MRQPLVSVCVPAYNYGRYLADCIESVLAQTYGNWELIVCDDCSTDDTEQVVRSYADADPRIRYVRNDRQLGMNGNIKHAADLGKGEYLKVLCADDWIAPRCLEVLTALMEQHPGVALATSAEIHTSADGTPLKVQFLFGEPVSVVAGERMLDRMARGSGFGGNSSFFIRAEAYRRVGGYDGRVLYAGDYHLAARLCRIGDYLHTDEPLFYGRSHPASSSSNDPKRLADVHDWFVIPDEIFRPRRLGNREWRRYQRLTASLTARYLMNIVLQRRRGNVAYAEALRAEIARRGNFALGVPALVVHAPRRLFNRLTGRHEPVSVPPQSWMGTPGSRGSAPLRS